MKDETFVNVEDVLNTLYKSQNFIVRKNMTNSIHGNWTNEQLLAAIAIDLLEMNNEMLIVMARVAELNGITTEW